MEVVTWISRAKTEHSKKFVVLQLFVFGSFSDIAENNNYFFTFVHAYISNSGDCRAHVHELVEGPYTISLTGQVRTTIDAGM